MSLHQIVPSSPTVPRLFVCAPTTSSNTSAAPAYYLRRLLSASTLPPTRRALDAVFLRHLSARRYLRLCAKIAAKATVKRIMNRFIPVCDTCRVRPAETCSAQKRDDFAGWVYRHQRWPKAGEGKWREVRPSCVEKKKSRIKANSSNKDGGKKM